MKWKYLKTLTDDKKKFIMDGYKVIHVIKTIYHHFGIVSWKGELTNDCYFIVTMANGILMVSINEREVLLRDSIIEVAYCDIIEDVFVEQAFEKRMSIILQKIPLLNDLITVLTFKDIMKVLKWKYVNKNVVEDYSLFEDNVVDSGAVKVIYDAIKDSKGVI